MRIHTVIMDLGPEDQFRVCLHGSGELLLKIGHQVLVWITEKDSPEVYAEMCERFELKETAPSGQTEDGDALGNEPGAQMVPQKVQV